MIYLSLILKRQRKYTLDKAQVALSSVIKGQARSKQPEFVPISANVFITPQAFGDPEANRYLPIILVMLHCKGAVITHQAALLHYLGKPAPRRIRYYTKDPSSELSLGPEQNPFGWEFEAVASQYCPGVEDGDGIPGYHSQSLKFAGKTFEVRIASPEQTLVDILDGRARGRRRLAHDGSEDGEDRDDSEDSSGSETSVDGIQPQDRLLDADYKDCWDILSDWKIKLNFYALRDYARIQNSKITMSKLGYFMHTFKSNFGLADVHLYGFKPHLDAPRNWKEKLAGNLDYRWMIRVPNDLLPKPAKEELNSIRPRLECPEEYAEFGILNLLRKHMGSHGIFKFRPGQDSLISAVIEGRDTLGVIPTGAGKSLCYQLPAILLNGVTLVVTPLVSLLNDQVEKAARFGIPAYAHRPAKNTIDRDRLIFGLENRTIKLVFTSPESLTNLISSCSLLKKAVVQVVVDEAHTIVSWGKDFRPSLNSLSRIRHFWPNVPILALTATATPDEQNAIMKLLGFRHGFHTYIGSTYRPALFLRTEKSDNEFDRLDRVIRFIKDQDQYRAKRVCGIVFCQTRHESEVVASALHRQFDLCIKFKTHRSAYHIKYSKFKKIITKLKSSLRLPTQIPNPKKGSKDKSYFQLSSTSRVQCYHASLTEQAKSQVSRLFKGKKPMIVVATIAFGMGIDRNDVRFVVNFGPPASISDYMQEVGRAARDGHDAECLLLHDWPDWTKRQRWLDGEESKLSKDASKIPAGKLKAKKDRLIQRREELNKLKRLVDYRSKRGRCLHQGLGSHFGEKLSPCERHCEVCENLEQHRRGLFEEISQLDSTIRRCEESLLAEE